jgi:hypothetical protein
MAVRMTWVIHIRRGTKRFEYTAEELHAALAVASLLLRDGIGLLRDGIGVERIDGPDGLQLSVDVIRQVTGVVGLSLERHMMRLSQ